MSSALCYCPQLIIAQTNPTKSQTPTENKSGDKAVATARKPAKALRPLSPQEAFEPLDDLERQAKLLTSPFPGQTFHYRGLRPDNCFGLVLSNGKRLVGQSDGLIGFEGEVDKVKVVSIGFLWTEGPLIVGGKELAPGSYVLFAGESMIRISEQPMPFGVEVPLATKIDITLLKTGSKEPFFSILRENDTVYLQLGANRLLIELK